jgi:N,N'-diacetyllegionaminate synthase
MKRRKGTYIIAEAGVNHNGSLEIAKRLVKEAKKAGADAVKFQTFRAERLVSRFAGKAEYQKKTTARDESQLEMIRKLELSESDHAELMDLCRKRKIDFLSSPFDEEGADLLDRLGVPAFKIPSGEITNHPFLEHIAGKKKPMILSTGMSSLEEVKEAVAVIFSTGNGALTLLHCVTEYPAPVEEINLRAMITMKEVFGLPVGYSDHTPGIEIAVAAVALGAAVIEKHFTLYRNMPGPDHKASLEPSELQAMVKAIRNVEKALGDGKKMPAPCEAKNMVIARKSIVALKPIGAGEVINREEVGIKRPGNGIQPKDLEKIIGLKAKRNIGQDEVITWEDLAPCRRGSRC